MITYHIPHISVIEEIERKGHRLVSVNGVWQSSDDVAVQAIIDSFDWVAAFRAERIQAVKSLANDKILAIVPAWKQSNMNARMAELNAISSGIHPGVGKRPLTQDEQNEISAMLSVFDQVRAIRTKSDDHEAAINAIAGQDRAAYDLIAAYDIRVGW